MNQKLKANQKEPVCILGGGLSGLSFACFSKFKSIIFEKEKRLGGLCRSFKTNDIYCDIGPHIFFSKNKKALNFLTSLTEMHKKRRSNKIFYKNIFVKYPFENELSALPDADRQWCLNTFLENCYSNYDAPNMLMFFYKTFGEGITRAYLEPYNRKIWKFEPSFMDTQMVERIPRPPAEDIVASANGISTEGYQHQLYFQYPCYGGVESIINFLAKRCGDKISCHTSASLEKLSCKKNGTFVVTTDGKTYEFERIVSTIPLQELIPRMEPQAPEDVKGALDELIYNSIHITIINASEENIGNNFAIMVPRPDILFHRVSKLDFLGDNYHLPDSSTIMVETTFRKGDRLDIGTDDISDLVIKGLERIKLVPSKAIRFIKTRSFKYAYVVYDLNHRKNTDKILKWLKSLGIITLGRFGTFEYLNMDKAIQHSKEIALNLNKSNDGNSQIQSKHPKQIIRHIQTIENSPTKFIGDIKK